jgi:hypothetical protein
VYSGAQGQVQLQSVTFVVTGFGKGYEEGYRVLGCDVMERSRKLPTFRRELLSPY